MYWLLIAMGGYVFPPRGSSQNLVTKEKWVLNNPILLSDRHLGDILERRRNQGKDMRFPENDTSNSDTFRQLYYKLFLLQYLENPNVPFPYKEEKAKEYCDSMDTIAPNLLKGGLMDDWNFEF